MDFGCFFLPEIGCKGKMVTITRGTNYDHMTGGVGTMDVGASTSCKSLFSS